jgi:hypothetical protein
LQRIEHLLDSNALVDGVEDDLRLARGKIIVIAKNNLAKFETLVKVIPYIQ